MRIALVLAAIVPLTVLAGCSKDSAAPTASSAPSAAAKPSSTAPASAAAVPTAAAPAAAMVEIDLSTADPAWKGWVVQGPKEAKVLADGVKGARVAANGMDAFDLAFAQGKTVMKEVKSGVEAGVKGSGGSLKVTYTVDTADKLEWTTEVAGTKSYNFVWALKASGTDVSCRTNAAMGASEALVAQLKTACGTLKKK